jgi:7-cyano-7-deazaguanine synthase in queuosine biosynthesis
MIVENIYGKTEFPLLAPSEVLCSGGADSTIMAFLLLEHLEPNERKNVKLTFLKNANSNFGAYISVLGYFSKRYDIPMSVSTIERTGEGHFLRGELLEYFNKQGVPMYTGVTKNPPVEIQGLPPNRAKKNITPNLYTPFLHLDKRFTIQLYKDNNLLDLLDLTWTCTQSLETPCNQCFACNEKNWAVKECL